MLAACGSSDTPAATPTSSPQTTPANTALSTTAPTADATTQAKAPSSTTAPATTRPAIRPATTATPSPSERRRDATATKLPLDLTTGDADQVITVVTSGKRDTTGTLQRWKRDGSRWRKIGDGIDAYVGSSGVGEAREGSSKTPAGSFTLTQAFGRDSDPGTRLPYVKTTPDDYWISSPGPKYNTRQRCGDCGYKDGVNERLYYVTPEYAHAVVIDYNTENAPGGVKAGKGSAFFLHVEAGEPTAGCVSIPEDDLETVMRWLKPSADPRILIGVD